MLQFIIVLSLQSDANPVLELNNRSLCAASIYSAELVPVCGTRWVLMPWSRMLKQKENRRSDDRSERKQTTWLLKVKQTLCCLELLCTVLGPAALILSSLTFSALTNEFMMLKCFYGCRDVWPLTKTFKKCLSWVNIELFRPTRRTWTYVQQRKLLSDWLRANCNVSKGISLWCWRHLNSWKIILFLLLVV